MAERLAADGFAVAVLDLEEAACKGVVEAKAGWGRIVNLSSTSALGKRGQADYSAAKAGVQGFIETVTLEDGKFGVTANAIAPGFIEFDTIKATAKRMGYPFPDFKAALVEDIPVGRAGLPADSAHAVSFLASEGRRLHLRPGAVRGGRAEGMRGFDGVRELDRAVGTHLGYSDRHSMSQDQINAFAAVVVP